MMPKMQIGVKEALSRELDETRELLEESEHRERELRRINQSQRERLDSLEVFSTSHIELDHDTQEIFIKVRKDVYLATLTGEQ